METYYVCFLTVLAVVMMIVWLVVQYRRAVKRTEERLGAIRKDQDEMMGRIRRLEEGEPKGEPAKLTGRAETPSLSGEKPLTVEGIAECVRGLGYEAKIGEDSVTFVKDDDTYIIDTDRMPRLFLGKSYRVHPDDWDMELLQQAAYQMTGELMMIKVDLSDGVDADGNRVIRFFLSAMDRTFDGFRQNLPEYIEIIDAGHQRTGQVYNELVKRKDETTSLDTLTDASSRQAGKTPS